MKNKALRRIQLCLIALLISVCCNEVVSQESQNRSDQRRPSPFWSQVRFGGGIGLSFGSGYFSGTLAPSALYPLSDYVALGVGLSFTYNDFQDNYTSAIVGGSLISLFNPIPEIQLSAEFEQMYVSRDYDMITGIQDEEYWYPGLFLGAGYGNRNVTVGIRFDVLYDSDRSIYANPWVPFVRVYF